MKERFKLILNEIVNVIFSIIVAVLIFLALHHYVVQPFRVEGHSMEPTLSTGEQMMLLKLASVERFDIIVFPDPQGKSTSYVKRVIGLPGDQISYENDQLILNGQAYDEPYLQPLKDQDPSQPFTQDFSLQSTTGLEEVPSGYYFVLGDNRPNSGDSRQFGLVPIDSVMGEANFVYYPWYKFGSVTQYELNPSKASIIAQE